MFPFIKKDMDAAVSAPPDVIKREPDEESEYDGMDAAADDLISAIHAKDSKGVAAALRAAFEICDSEPHEEGPTDE